MRNFRTKYLVGVSALFGATLMFTSMLPSSGVAGGEETITRLPDLTTTTAGEPLLYLSTPDPVITSDILTVPPGGVSRWMTHPVPAYIYILQGDLTIQFADGTEKVVHQGEIALQPRAAWHRGRNEGKVPLRFLAVFIGAKGVPGILHPPTGPLASEGR